MIALKGPFRQVAIDVDGTYGIICARHVNGNNCFAFDIYGLNIVIFQEVHIYSQARNIHSTAEAKVSTAESLDITPEDLAISDNVNVEWILVAKIHAQ